MTDILESSPRSARPRGPVLIAGVLAVALLVALVVTRGLPDRRSGAPIDLGSVQSLVDLDGAPFEPPLGERVQTFIFTRTDCPISNRYAPEVRRLVALFEDRGVDFHLVYIDPNRPIAEIRTHLTDYDYNCDALRDPDHELVALTGATVTPEAVIFAPDGALVYRGRIDNWYEDFGKARPGATRHDVEDTLEATLAGRPLELATTQAVGCFIQDLSP